MFGSDCAGQTKQTIAAKAISSLEKWCVIDTPLLLRSDCQRLTHELQLRHVPSDR
jgi:hypothetical protein